MFDFLKDKQKNKTAFISAVILCAGNSSRMKSELNKQLVMINDMPVIMHSIMAFEMCGYIDEIVLVTKQDMIADLNAMVREFECKKVKTIIKGGDVRTDSSKIGVEATSNETEYVLIHDGARPLITPNLVGIIADATVMYNAVAPCTPIYETVKRINDNNEIVQTLDRQFLRTVQTPQGFAKNLYLSAIYQNGDKIDLFDDCQLIESIGATVTLVPGERENIKITTLEDIDTVSDIMERRLERNI